MKAVTVVEPDVRVEVEGEVGVFDQLRLVERVGHRNRRDAQRVHLLEHLVELAFKIEPVVEDHVRAREQPDVARAGHEQVRVDARPHQAVELESILDPRGEHLDQVGDLRRGRDDPERLLCVGRRSGGDQEREHRQGDQAASCNSSHQKPPLGIKN